MERAKRGEYPVAFGEYILHYGYWRFMPSEDRLNLPPKPQPSRGKKDYVVAITAELV